MSTGVRKADLKVVLLGDVGVGKTCFILRYIDRRFQNTVSSIGAAFILKTWGNYSIAIWDTAGEEKYSKMSNFYCRNSGAAILIFDLTVRHTFENLKQVYVPLLNSLNAAKLKVVVGTKKDLLRRYARKVTEQEGQEFARSLNPDLAGQDVVPYFETSSRNGTNVDAAFEYVFQYFYPNGGSMPRPLTFQEREVNLASSSLNNHPTVANKKKPVFCCR